MSANIQLSKPQISKTKQEGGFCGKIIGPLIKVGSPLMKNVLTTLAKNVPLELTTTALAADPDIQKGS